MKATTKNLHRARQRLALLFVAFASVVLLCSVPARGATSCAVSELLELADPVVVVLDGPGDAVQEQERWSELGKAYTRSGQSLYLGEQKFELEREQ